MRGALLLVVGIVLFAAVAINADELKGDIQHASEATSVEEVGAHLTPEPTAHSDRIGEGSFGFPLNADGTVPSTNGKISITITAACTTNDIDNTLFETHGNRMSCHAGNRMSATECTQSDTTKSDYYDFTDFAAIMACGNDAWVESLQLYSKYQLWFHGIGHTADLSLVGKVSNWNGKVGKPCHVQHTAIPSNQ